MTASLQELDPQPRSVEQPVLWSLHWWNCLSVNLWESYRECWVMCLEKSEGLVVLVWGIFKANDNTILTGLESYTIFLERTDTFLSSLLDQLVKTGLKPPLWSLMTKLITVQIQLHMSIKGAEVYKRPWQLQFKLTFISQLSPGISSCLFIWKTQLLSGTLFLL